MLDPSILEKMSTREIMLDIHKDVAREHTETRAAIARMLRVHAMQARIQWVTIAIGLVAAATLVAVLVH